MPGLRFHPRDGVSLACRLALQGRGTKCRAVRPPFERWPRPTACSEGSDHGSGRPRVGLALIGARSVAWSGFWWTSTMRRSSSASESMAFTGNSRGGMGTRAWPRGYPRNMRCSLRPEGTTTQTGLRHERLHTSLQLHSSDCPRSRSLLRAEPWSPGRRSGGPGPGAPHRCHGGGREQSGALGGRPIPA